MGDFWEIDEILALADFEHERMLEETRVVDALVGEECYEIFSWMPRYRVLDWMSRMHSEFKLGTEHFLAKNIYEYPTDKKSRYQLKKTGKIRTVMRVINGTAFEITRDAKDANFDVIVLTYKDLKPLKQIAKKLDNHAANSREKSFGCMLNNIAHVISENKEIEEFIVYREI